MRLPVPDSVLYFENGRAAGDWLDCSVIGRIGGHSAPCVHISLQPVHLCLHAFKPVCSDQQVKGRIFGLSCPHSDSGELDGFSRSMTNERIRLFPYDTSRIASINHSHNQPQIFTPYTKHLR